MSQHIIKCKTILKVNEIETINLTLALNFHGERHRDMGTHVYKRLVGTGQGTGVVGPPVLVLPRRRDDSKCFAPEGVSFPTVNQAALSQHNVTERSAPAKSHMPGCGVSSLASFKWVLLSCKECNYVRLAVFRAVSQQTEHKYRRACRAA